MRLNVAFILLAGLTLVVAQDNHSSSGSAQASASASGAGDASAMIASLPKCFTECATKSATSATVGCTGLTDIGCVCSKPAFINATMVCITSSGGNECGQLAQNRTALAQGQEVFTSLCKAAGAASNSSSSGMAGMTGMTNGTSSTAGGASGTSSSGSTPAAGHNGAVMQQVATGSIVLTALLAGAATLL
ncbi:uncharacterized protein FA14DRAFT_185418 [Meira miltonrushii]|uniref:CFEM domain-containing protein n=1 Tax=Meira miltonrushii TaxID=1280837 RepID=A0A316VD81_9BASI|nr:uncharacterized protein FA14DRAFT_185418 [Meira miltonrushii]PWN33941.1 hypothetical protein FA14DRAFT_185418 [Meira miltonrushii]